jgi:hypothetical protein
MTGGRECIASAWRSPKRSPPGRERPRGERRRTGPTSGVAREADSQEWASLQVVPAATLTQDLGALIGCVAPFPQSCPPGRETPQGRK